MPDSRFHKNKGPYTLGQIATIIGCDIQDKNKEVIIDDVASLSNAAQGQITFLDNVKYKSQLSKSNAKAVILSPQMSAEFQDFPFIHMVSVTPYKAYAQVATLFYPQTYTKKSLIHPSAVIGDNVEIGEGTIIEANSVIADNVIIGGRCHIGANVTISHALIGDDVRIHNGVRIGQDGFGFAIDESGVLPVPQLGRVIIEPHVNIGSNTCIDRGSGPDTVIGAGTIIDNLVQIAHNVKIGKGCVIVSQVGISGSTEIDDYCVFGGQSGVAGHLKIGKGVQVGAQSGVTKNVEAGQKLMGFPARPIREYWREMAQIKKLLSK
jgi:UDP-3-O-[3-hydroxymyristoyl] glucosamine N-acyltransferase